MAENTPEQNVSTSEKQDAKAVPENRSRIYIKMHKRRELGDNVLTTGLKAVTGNRLTTGISPKTGNMLTTGRKVYGRPRGNISNSMNASKSKCHKVDDQVSLIYSNCELFTYYIL